MRRLAAFPVTALFVVLLMAPPAGAAFLGANGRIAYSKAHYQSPEIFTIDPDGTGPTRLTNMHQEDLDPAWSADGLRIAFARGFGALLLMDADGSNVSTVLTLDDLPRTYSSLSHPAWSPDGTMLAFCATKPHTFVGKVFTVGVDGMGLTKLSGRGDDDCGPAWSPDGTTIAIESFDQGKGDIVLLAADGSTREALLTAGDTRAPDWAPTGAELAFIKGDLFNADLPRTDLYTVNADGSGLARVTDTPERWELQPAWSPDGTRIVFSRTKGPRLFQFSDLWTIAPDGSAPDRVTFTPKVYERSPDWQPV
jgi:Tol biopolymer transport system component